MNSDGQISYRDEVRRKLVHLSSLWMPLVMWLVPYRWPLAGAFAVLAALSVVVEHLYAGRRYRTLNRLYDFFFHNMLRSEPSPRAWIISGGPYVLAAAALSLLCFPRLIAGCAMTAMLLGDTAAALIGRIWGRHKIINGKSLEGTLAFVLISTAAIAAIMCAAGLARYAWLAALAALVGSAAELFEKNLRIDDNFSIPLAVGAALMLGLELLGATPV